MLETAPDPTVSDPQQLLNLRLTVVKEYAKWCLLREYPLPATSEARKAELVRDMFQLGKQLRLTERDTVWLLLHDLLSPIP